MAHQSSTVSSSSAVSQSSPQASLSDQPSLSDQESPQDSSTQSSHQDSSPSVRSTWPLHLFFALVAGVVAAIISATLLGDSLAALGIPDPGRLTTAGLPLLRGVAWVLAALSIGSFLLSCFLIPPATGTRLVRARLTVDGVIAARTGAICALFISIIGVVMVPLSLSDVSGTPLSGTFDLAAWALSLDKVSGARVWLITAGVGLLVAGFSLTLHSWIAQPALFLLSLWLVIPLGMDGHSAVGGNHDYGTNSYLWHLVCMAVWVGGLMALLAHGRRLGPHLGRAISRYSTIALFCYVGMWFSGLINSAILLRWSEWFTTSYGRLILTKAILLVILGVFGYAHRRYTMQHISTHPRMFLRFAVGELVFMAAVVGVAVTLTRTPPPPPRDPNISPMSVELGYDLLEPPSLLTVLTMWRFDVMFGTLALLLAGIYLWLLRRVHRTGQAWSGWRTCWWMCGCAFLFITTSSGIGLYMPAMYSMHMTGHMLLSTVVPVFLCLGGPLSLLRAAYPPTENSFSPGDMAEAIWESPLIRVLTHPVVNLIQFVFFFYILYLIIPLYNLAISEHAGHVIMNYMFLISGYIYFWEVIGVDPLPGRRPSAIRLAWLSGSMVIHLFAGVYLMQLTTVMGEQFYQDLMLPFAVDLLYDQRVGGGIGWGSMSFPLAIVFGLLFWGWWKEEHNAQREYDRRADEGDNMDYEEYNQWLSQLHNRS